MSIHYKIVGEGYPIVMLHGWTLDHRLLFRAMEPLFDTRAGWKRVYLDLPGMGCSEPDPAIRSSDDMLAAVLRVLDTLLPNEPFVVCGNSYGGYLARGIARFRPHLVRGMLLIAPMIIPEPADRNLPARCVLKQDAELLARLSPEDAAEFASISVIQGQAEWERFQTDILLPSRKVDHAFIDYIRNHGYGFTFDPEGDQPAFRYPVMMITGRQDHAVGYQDQWRLLEHYPRATFAVLDTAGHNLVIEQPDVFEGLAGNWLDRLGPRSSGE